MNARELIGASPVMCTVRSINANFSLLTLFLRPHTKDVNVEAILAVIGIDPLLILGNVPYAPVPQCTVHCGYTTVIGSQVSRKSHASSLLHQAEDRGPASEGKTARHSKLPSSPATVCVDWTPRSLATRSLRQSQILIHLETKLGSGFKTPRLGPGNLSLQASCIQHLP